MTSWGGFALEPVVLAKAKGFLAGLQDEGYAVDESSFVSAGYDPPFRLSKRHNEIWIRAVETAKQ